jgi:hypothetical protein
MQVQSDFTALILAVSGFTPSFDNVCPKNFSCDLLNLHFALLSVRCFSRNLCNRSVLSCSSWFFANMIISSALFLQLGMSWSIYCMIRWWISGAELIPNIKRLYLYRPLWHTNVVINRDFSSNSIWWNDWDKSSLSDVIEKVQGATPLGLIPSRGSESEFRHPYLCRYAIR